MQFQKEDEETATPVYLCYLYLSSSKVHSSLLPLVEHRPIVLYIQAFGAGLDAGRLEDNAAE
jgi:hypothetical protein